MSKYKLIATDLDGTLLNSKSEVSDENIKAIAECYSIGVPVVPTTGRALGEIPKSVFNSKEVRYFLTSNGSALYDREKDSFTFRRINKENLDYLFRLVDSTESIVCVHYGGECFVSREQFDDYARYNIPKYYHDALIDSEKYVDSIADFIDSVPGVEKFIAFFASDDDLASVLAELREADLFNVTAAEAHSIEVTAKNATKGLALADFAASFGFDISEVIAVGDSGNDASMLAVAGLPLVVSNGVPAAKKLASEIIYSNDEHAIKYILENILESE